MNENQLEIDHILNQLDQLIDEIKDLIIERQDLDLGVDGNNAIYQQLWESWQSKSQEVRKLCDELESLGADSKTISYYRENIHLNPRN